MKLQQLIICVFCAMLGIAMIINSWGNLGLTAIVSDVVGIALIAIGTFGVLLFFRNRLKRKTEN